MCEFEIKNAEGDVCCNKKVYKNVTNIRQLIGFLPIIGPKFSRYFGRTTQPQQRPSLE